MTAETAKTAIEQIKNIGLKVPSWFYDLTPQEIASAYNGVGSCETAKPIRKVLTYIFMIIHRWNWLCSLLLIV